MAQMVSKHRLLIVIPAIILIPLLLGLIPLNIAHKLSKGIPFVHCKQMQLGNCLFNALGSQDEHTVASLHPTRLEQESTRADNFIVLNINSIYHNISLDSVPLRC
jgi:hypothetical protein